MKTRFILIAAIVIFSGAMYFLLTIDHLKWGNSALERKEFDRAFSYFVKAANQGNATALYQAGLMLQNGQGTEKNIKRAVDFYRQAAEQNHSGAVYQLARLQQKGEHLPRDTAAAAAKYKKAAELGNPDAQFELGLILAEGRFGFVRDYAAAVEWYKKSANSGHADAQFNLAGMYQFGQGVDADPVEAYIWYSIAANFGRNDAVKIRDYVVGNRITGNQIEKAHDDAKERLAKIEAGKSLTYNSYKQQGQN